MEGNDAAAVAQVLSGDEGAFREIVERHGRTLFRVAFRIMNNEQDAEDVVQESLLRAYRQLNRFESRSNFGTWLYRIALNCALDLRRKKQKESERHEKPTRPEATDPVMDLPDGSPTPDRLIEGVEIQRRVDQTLSAMGEKERAAFILRHFEGRSIAEIAKILGLRESATKNSIFRAVQKLRRELESLTPSSP